MNFIKYVGTRKMRRNSLYIIKKIFLMLGKSWNDFYGWMLDIQDRQLRLEDILVETRSSKEKYKGLWDWKRGEYFLTYLKKHGLKTNHTIFDLGCGYGRTTIPVLKYLKDGKYIGSEISRKRIALAEEWIKKENLLNKNYDLVFSKDNNLSFLKNDSLDMVWILSVFNHMPDADLENLLSSLFKKIKKTGKIFAYTVNEHCDTKRVQTFPRTPDQIKDLYNKYKFNFKLMKDFNDDYSDQNAVKHINMFLLTK